MMTKIEALKMIAEGFTALAQIEEEANVSIPAPAKAKKEAKKAEKKEVPVVEEPAEEEEIEITVEDLEKMSFKELKQTAVDLGIDPKGTKATLLSALKKAIEEGEESSDEAEEVEDDSAGTSAEDVDEDTQSDTHAMVLNLIEENGFDDSQLREILKDVGISTKGSHEVLVDKIVSAVDDGLLQFDDEDSEDEEESDEQEDSVNESEDVEEADDSEEEENSVRAEAVAKLVEDTRSEYEEGEIDDETIKEFLEQFGDVKIPKKATSDTLLNLYIDNISLLVNDEGELVEEGAYTIDGEPYCCGRPLEVEDGEATCPICGESYEFEEE